MKNIKKQYLSKKRERLLLFGMLFFLCFVLYRNINNAGIYISARTRFDTAMELDSIKKENEMLRSYKESLEEKLARAEFALDDLKVNYEDILSDELSEYESLAGMNDLYGPGIIMFVQDGLSDPKPGESISNYLVHDIDLIAIVDELRNAGAEAISINGERILYNETDIKCVGPVIMIGGRQVAPPFEIRAIGDRNELVASMNAPGGFIDILRGWSIQIEVDTAMYVEVPKYKGVMK